MDNATRERRKLGPYVRPTHQLARRRVWLAQRLTNSTALPEVWWRDYANPQRGGHVLGWICTSTSVMGEMIMVLSITGIDALILALFAALMLVLIATYASVQDLLHNTTRPPHGLYTPDRSWCWHCQHLRQHHQVSTIPTGIN